MECFVEKYLELHPRDKDVVFKEEDANQATNTTACHLC